VRASTDQASFDIEMIRHLADTDTWVEPSQLCLSRALGTAGGRRGGGQGKGDGDGVEQEEARKRLREMLRVLMTAVESSSAEYSLEDIPEEFLDPLTCSLMVDPVILPSSVNCVLGFCEFISICV